ncbi:hypothetical protein CEXT_723531 [Caerostris extrusa]|uniref:Uncharacterized protein n=1 Tax=Caerostris extrusa TaxID=172846 RepID=A0AAV4QI18_CAEEX|nr:hypothetical protein CEXT_723531 [Caerostris extrusa]
MCGRVQTGPKREPVICITKHSFLRFKPNVCIDEKNITTIPEMEEIDTMAGEYDMIETCKGNGIVYVCVSRRTENGETVRKMKTYECCEGFDRPADGGIGCVREENSMQSNDNRKMEIILKKKEQKLDSS